MTEMDAIIAILSVGTVLGGIILRGHSQLHRDIGTLREDVGSLRERMARLEGLFDGFTKRPKELE